MLVHQRVTFGDGLYRELEVSWVIGLPPVIHLEMDFPWNKPSIYRWCPHSRKPRKPPIDGKIVMGQACLGASLGMDVSSCSHRMDCSCNSQPWRKSWVCRNGISWGFIGISRGYDGIYHGILWDIIGFVICKSYIAMEFCAMSVIGMPLSISMPEVTSLHRKFPKSLVP